MNRLDRRPEATVLGTGRTFKINWAPQSGYVNGHPNLVTPLKADYARRLRTMKTPAERKLWNDLLSRRQAGVKVRQQAVLFGYIVDFWCPRLSLAIEVGSEGYRDGQREMHLRNFGIKILRLSNRLVLDDWETAADIVRTAIETSHQHPKEDTHVADPA